MATSARAPSLTAMLPKFDRRSVPVYSMLAATLLANCLLWQLLGLRFDPPADPLLPCAVVFAIFVATMLRRAGRERTSAALELIAITVAQGFAALRFQYPMAALSRPLVDKELRAVDAFLGFDWLSFTLHFQQPWTIRLLSISYDSLFWQPLVAIIILCASRNLTRAWRCMDALFIAVLISILALAAFPADGAFTGCGLNSPGVWVRPHFCQFGPIVSGLRNGGVREITTAMSVGVVFFPSFHAAASALFVWAIWPLKWLRAPALALNLSLLIATITIGEHYLIDILAGLALAAFSVVVSQKVAVRMGSIN